MEVVSKHNADPIPFVWTKSVEVILEKVSSAKQSIIVFEGFTTPINPVDA